MYQHILFAVALQHWDAFSPHAVAAREAAVALAHGSSAQWSVLSVYDDGNAQPDALSLPPEDVSRERDPQMQRIEAQRATKLQTFLAGVAIRELSMTPRLKVGHPRQLIVATAEGLGVDMVVMGAHSKLSVLGVLLGGTAAVVSRHALWAIVMVQPGEQRPLVQTDEVGQIRQEPIPG